MMEAHLERENTAGFQGGRRSSKAKESQKPLETRLSPGASSRNAALVTPLFSLGDDCVELVMYRIVR